MNRDGAVLLEQDVAALDEMLRAIGRWQAAPSEETWDAKVSAIKHYLAAVESWGPDFRSSVFRHASAAVRP